MRALFPCAIIILSSEQLPLTSVSIFSLSLALPDDITLLKTFKSSLLKLSIQDKVQKLVFVFKV